MFGCEGVLPFLHIGVFSVGPGLAVKSRLFGAKSKLLLPVLHLVRSWVFRECMLILR